MITKCPECGSAIKNEGKFCSYCGAKLPDDVKRTEIKIDNVAEVMRAGYEERFGERELQMRERREKFEQRSRRMKRIIPLILLMIGLICIALGFISINIEGSIVPWWFEIAGPIFGTLLAILGGWLFIHFLIHK